MKVCSTHVIKQLGDLLERAEITNRIRHLVLHLVSLHGIALNKVTERENAVRQQIEKFTKESLIFQPQFLSGLPSVHPIESTDANERHPFNTNGHGVYHYSGPLTRKSLKRLLESFSMMTRQIALMRKEKKNHSIQLLTEYAR